MGCRGPMLQASPPIWFHLPIAHKVVRRWEKTRRPRTNRKQQYQHPSLRHCRHGSNNFRKDHHHSRSKYDGSFLHAQWSIVVAWSMGILLSPKARRIAVVPKLPQTQQYTNQHSDTKVKWSNNSLHPYCKHITNHRYHRRRRRLHCFGFGKLDPLIRKLEKCQTQ